MKSYDRLILQCIAGWLVVALGVLAIVGFGVVAILLAVTWALALGSISARCIDRRSARRATR